jgi:hypothetical protein
MVLSVVNPSFEPTVVPGGPFLCGSTAQIAVVQPAPIPTGTGVAVEKNPTPPRPSFPSGEGKENYFPSGKGNKGSPHVITCDRAPLREIKVGPLEADATKIVLRQLYHFVDMVQGAVCTDLSAVEDAFLQEAEANKDFIWSGQNQIESTAFFELTVRLKVFLTEVIEQAKDHIEEIVSDGRTFKAEVLFTTFGSDAVESGDIDANSLLALIESCLRFFDATRLKLEGTEELSCFLEVCILQLHGIYEDTAVVFIQKTKRKRVTFATAADNDVEESQPVRNFSSPLGASIASCDSLPSSPLFESAD